MSNKVDFDHLGIAKVLKDNRLKVPLNQREYAWEVEHVTDLLTDIADSMRKRRDVYFLGTIVLTTTPNEILEVSDGQQRLATTTIMLAAIRDIFLELNDEQRATSIEQEFLYSIDIVTRERIPKLTLNADDNEFFGSRILSRPDERNEGVAASRGSHELLFTAYKTIREYFAALRKQLGSGYDEALLAWRHFLLNSASVIILKVPDDLDAFVMFETLNDRGLKTSQADLVKNLLFKEADDRRAEAQTYWSSMRGGIASIGEDDLTIDYLRHVCNLLYGQTRERDVFEKIKESNRGKARAIQLLFLLNELAYDYAAILNPDHPKWNPYPPSLRDRVKTLNLLGVSQIRPLLLSTARHFKPKEAAKAFNRFVAWAVRFIICGGGRGGDLERRYCDLANQIHSGKIKTVADLDKSAAGVIPTDAQFEASFGAVRIQKSNLARYLLRDLEFQARNETDPEWVVNQDQLTINLEHIMPQTIAPEWPEISDRDVETHSHRLGNLVLIQAKVNSAMDRSTFENKKSSLVKSDYVLTKEVAEYGKWGVEEIDLRQKALAKLAVKTWPIA